MMCRAGAPRGARWLRPRVAAPSPRVAARPGRRLFGRCQVWWERGNGPTGLLRELPPRPARRPPRACEAADGFLRSASALDASHFIRADLAATGAPRRAGPPRRHGARSAMHSTCTSQAARHTAARRAPRSPPRAAAPEAARGFVRHAPPRRSGALVFQKRPPRCREAGRARHPLVFAARRHLPRARNAPHSTAPHRVAARLECLFECG